MKEEQAVLRTESDSIGEKKYLRTLIMGYSR